MIEIEKKISIRHVSFYYKTNIKKGVDLGPQIGCKILTI